MHKLIVLALLISNSLALFAEDRGDLPQRRVLQVFDANGKAAGAFRYFGGSGGVFTTANGASVFVPIVRRAVAGTGNQTSYSATEFGWGSYFINQFISADCSGAPLITDTGPRPSSMLRRGAEVTVYVAPGTDSQFLRVSSYLLGTNGQCQRYTTAVTQSGWPVESSYVITQDHPEPLSVHY